MIGDRVKERREALEMSQNELAIKLGYKSRSSIAEIEKGKKEIPIKKIDEFAKALKTSTEYLMELEINDVGINDERIKIVIEKMSRMSNREMKLIEMYIDTLMEK